MTMVRVSLVCLLGFMFARFASAQEVPDSEPDHGPAPAAVPAPVVATASVQGTLLERGTKIPLADVNVFLLPAKLKATTDKNGRFRFDSAPVGDVQFVANAPGYKRMEKKASLAPGANEARFLIERVSYQAAFESVTVSRADKRDDSVRSLSRDQFLTMPGSNGDPVKAVQNLPGVARVQGFSGQIVIQGSAPKDTRYLLDDHSVPLIFHFGGLTSIVTPEAVERVDYLAAGYGPDQGRAIGGIVNLKLRDPATDRTKGFFFVDTFTSGGLIEGQISEKSSYLATARYSYIGYVLQAVLKGNEQFDLTVAPSFADASGIYRYKANERDDIRLVGIASRDELTFLLKEPVRTDPALRGEFRNETVFFRVIPEWTRKVSADETWKASLGIGNDSVQIGAGDNGIKLNAWTITQRAEIERKLSPVWKSSVGLDNQMRWNRINVKIPSSFEAGGVRTPFSVGELIDTSIERDAFYGGLFWRNEIREAGSRWTLMPSSRLDFFTDTNQVLPAPRFATRYTINESLFLKSSTGLYFQPPTGQESSPIGGNPNIKAPWAWHATVGADKDWRDQTGRGFQASGSVFYRGFENQVVPSSAFVTRDGSLVAERFNNGGRGKAFGLETLVRYDQKPWSGWIAYTISQSTRQDRGQPEYVFEFDQTHNVNVIGAYESQNNWKYSARVRYVTGNPITPIASASFDADNDVYLPIRGAFYSERLDSFFQLDVRIDKKWIFDNSVWSAYLDIQNLTNRGNPESVQYSYDYSQRRNVTGLPILPTFGVRGEF